MCGIAGVFTKDRRPSDAAEWAAGMIRAVRHRGPDAGGSWVGAEGRLALAHARLAILDLSEAGAQPMRSSAGDMTLIMNGEIYNFLELREELSREGARFRGGSDTEVLLEAMQRWGVETAVKRARGMFALAVWSAKEDCLWLARDRVGKKPLYYFEDPGRFAFSSEIKGLLALPGVDARISRRALSDYLSLGYVVGPRTIYERIKELPPGEIMRVGPDLSLSRASYWSYPAEAPVELGPEELEREAERLLEEAVRLRLRADVPVGIFLSGGIDSGLITAFAARHSSSRVRTFTVGFGGGEFDETEMARAVARRYGTDHEEIRISPEISTLLPKVVRAYDEPFADASAFPTYAVAAAASKRVKVVLNGEGSDELMGGYRRAFAMKLAAALARPLRLVPGCALASAARFLPASAGQRTSLAFLQRFLRGAGEDPQSRYISWSSDGFSEDEKRRLGLEDGVVPTAAGLAERLSGYEKLEPTAYFMALDFLVGMTDCLLPKVDIATMAHGLEGRSPFLDQEFVGWAARVAKSSLLGGRETKPVLRSIARRLLPAEVAAAPKRGFEPPLVRWMTGELRPMVRETCLSSRSALFDLLDRREVAAVLDRRTRMDDARWAKRAWTLFMLAAWGEAAHEARLHRS